MKISEYIKEGVAVHCNTETKANDLLRLADDNGYLWCTGQEYVTDEKVNSNYDTYLTDTCYSIDCGTYSSKEFYQSKGYKIITI